MVLFLMALVSVHGVVSDQEGAEEDEGDEVEVGKVAATLHGQVP